MLKDLQLVGKIQKAGVKQRQVSQYLMFSQGCWWRYECFWMFL